MTGWLLAGGGLLALLLGWAAVVARQVSRGRARTRRVAAVYRAAASGDEDRLRQEVAGAASVDLQDRDGNSALHLAHYDGREEAVARLMAYGADAHLRNREGLTPPEMAEVAQLEGLLREGAGCLTPGGAWRDERRARVLYEQLRSVRPRLYNPALVRVVLGRGENRTLLYFAIKLGVRGSEEKLAEVLDGYGDVRMATDFLNAGSLTLRQAAERWAARHQYRIHRTAGRALVTWGRF